jgi:hypothetical protein
MAAGLWGYFEAAGKQDSGRTKHREEENEAAGKQDSGRDET